MKIAFNTMELMENRTRNSVGSSRIRGNWLLKYWPDAELFHFGRQYDAVVYQKAYDLEHMRAFQGIKVFDLCDADWLQGRPVREVLELCDGAVTSTEALAEYLRQMTTKPVLCIPDRVDLEEHQMRKIHSGPARAVAWYGYADNHPVLDACLTTLKRLGLRLVVLSDSPYAPTGGVHGIDERWLRENLMNLPYDQEHFADDICGYADIVLNPKLGTGRFRFKSSNKTVISWALGMPVAHDAEELEALIPEDTRVAEVVRRRREVEAKWDVRQSVQEYQAFIAGLQHGKTGDTNGE